MSLANVAFIWSTHFLYPNGVYLVMIELEARAAYVIDTSTFGMKCDFSCPVTLV